MSWTTVTAIYGAVVATVAAVISIQSRLDAIWGRRGKVIGEARPKLTSLRDLLAEAQSHPRAASALRSHRVRAALSEIDELRGRTADARLSRQLAMVHQTCSTAAAAPSGPAPNNAYAVGVAVDAAMAAVLVAIDRLDQIERKAPP